MTTAIDMENLDKFAELVKVAKEQGCYDLVSAALTGLHHQQATSEP